MTTEKMSNDIQKLKELVSKGFEQLNSRLDNLEEEVKTIKKVAADNQESLEDLAEISYKNHSELKLMLEKQI